MSAPLSDRAPNRAERLHSRPFGCFSGSDGDNQALTSCAKTTAGNHYSGFFLAARSAARFQPTQHSETPTITPNGLRDDRSRAARSSCGVGEPRFWTRDGSSQETFLLRHSRSFKKIHFFRLSFDSSVTSLMTEVLHQTVKFCSCFSVRSIVHKNSRFPGNARHHFELRVQYRV